MLKTCFGYDNAHDIYTGKDKNLPEIRRAIREIDRAINYRPAKVEYQALKEAIVAASKTFEQDIKDIETASLSFMKQHEYQKAYQLLEKIEKIDPDRASVKKQRNRISEQGVSYFVKHAELFTKQGDYSAAIDELEKALYFSPSSDIQRKQRTCLRMKKAKSLYIDCQKKHPSGILVDLKEMISLHPENEHYHNMLEKALSDKAREYIKAGRSASAYDCLLEIRRIKKLNRHDKAVYSQLKTRLSSRYVAEIREDLTSGHYGNAYQRIQLMKDRDLCDSDCRTLDKTF